MNPSYALWEIVLFAMINFLPFVSLSLYTFQKQWRFSKITTLFLCFLLFTIQFLTRLWSAVNNIDLSVRMSILRLILFLAIYAVMFDILFRKILFIELVFANVGNFIIIASVCLERNLFSSIEHHPYCWHSSLTMILLHLAITAPLFLIIKRAYRELITSKFMGKQWNYYWIVPAIFYLIWQYQMHGGELKGMDVATDPSTVIFLFIINIGSLLIYHIMIMLDAQVARNWELSEKAHYQEIEKLEYRLLEKRIAIARHARHDLRHHMMMMSEYLNAKEYDKLQEYMNDYLETMPTQQTLSFCSHRAIDSIMLHYAQQAQENNIDFQIQLHLAESIAISDTDICIILGNLLENALHACIEYPGDRKIIIHGQSSPHSLSFTIDNTYNNKLKQNAKGDYLSTKKTGSGLGLKSAQYIVERYHGFFKVNAKDDMFYVSFILNL